MRCRDGMTVTWDRMISQWVRYDPLRHAFPEAQEKYFMPSIMMLKVADQ